MKNSQLKSELKIVNVVLQLKLSEFNSKMVIHLRVLLMTFRLELNVFQRPWSNLDTAY